MPVLQTGGFPLPCLTWTGRRQVLIAHFEQFILNNGYSVMPSLSLVIVSQRRLDDWKGQARCCRPSFGPTLKKRWIKGVLKNAFAYAGKSLNWMVVEGRAFLGSRLFSQKYPENGPPLKGLSSTPDYCPPWSDTKHAFYGCPARNATCQITAEHLF